MRFKFTIFLFVANVVLFLSIWSLEVRRDASPARAADAITFTRLEISGKNVDKPRILSFENNKWRIISPIEWPANLYAVNRIRNQLEFLSKETSFTLADMKKYGHTLEEYGLEDPLFTIKYGNERKMNAVRVGNAAPIGGRVYMLDEGAGKVVVVDKEFIENLVLDVERLRNQRVFDIPRFEVAAFSVRMPIGDESSGQANFKRIGLVKDAGNWKIETPISAPADNREVEAFIEGVCQLTASSFDAPDDAGFGLMPTTITLQGTNRRRVLMLGNHTKDGKQIYARLDGNPTVFTVDAEKLKNLSGLQNMLRDKAFFKFDASDVSNIDISKGTKVLKLRKLTGGVWDVIGTGKNGEAVTAKADLSRVNDLISKLSEVRARDFVNDLPGEDLSKYGIGENCLKIRITQSGQDSSCLAIGSNYDYRGAILSYAVVEGAPAVYGVSRALENAASTDFLFYRSKMLMTLPEKAKIMSIGIFSEKSGKALFSLRAENGDLQKAMQMLSQRESAAAAAMADCMRNFTVKDYLPEGFSKSGVSVDGKKIDWALRIEAEVELPGTGAASQVEKLVWYATRAQGGTVQYGGSESLNSVYGLTAPVVDALRELTIERVAPRQLGVESPVPAESKPMENIAPLPSEGGTSKDKGAPAGLGKQPSETGAGIGDSAGAKGASSAPSGKRTKAAPTQNSAK